MSKATWTWDNTTASRKRTRTKRYNEESRQAGRHTPITGISSKATLPSAWRDSCTTPVCCQLWHMVHRHGHWPNKHRTNLRGRRPKWKEVCSTSHTKIEIPTYGSGRGKSHRYNPHCKKNEMVLGRAYQPPHRRPMDLACHHLETIWQEKTTRETSQAVERRSRQVLERHDMAEESTRQGNLETACWGLRPTTGHNGCLMMMKWWTFVYALDIIHLKQDWTPTSSLHGNLV